MVAAAGSPRAPWEASSLRQEARLSITATGQHSRGVRSEETHRCRAQRARSTAREGHVTVRRKKTGRAGCKTVHKPDSRKPSPMRARASMWCIEIVVAIKADARYSGCRPMRKVGLKKKKKDLARRTTWSLQSLPFEFSAPRPGECGTTTPPS
jgi:hypothetical protein